MSLVPLDDVIGAQLIALIASSVVYGITCLQVYVYYTEYSTKDGPFLRSYVALMMTLDTLHLALLSYTIYHWTVTNFGDYLALAHVPWSILVQIVAGSTIFVAFELAFAWRIYRLSSSKNWWIPVIMIILTFANYSCSITSVVKGFTLGGFVDAAADFHWGWASFATGFACDVTMTSSIIYYLKKNRTRFSRTNRAVNMLIAYALNTGLLVAIFTLITLALTIAYPNNLIYTPFYNVLVRLYSCSFMSTLNTRHAVRSALGGVRETLPLSSLGSSAGTPESGGDAQQVLELKSERSLSLA